MRRPEFKWNARGPAIGMGLEVLVQAPKWTSVDEFPRSTQLSEQVFSLGNGFYLVANPRRGDGRRVHTVGWANSDFWARRVWDGPPEHGPQEPLPTSFHPMPDLVALGVECPLRYAEILAFETERSERAANAMLEADYRVTDGAFLYVAIRCPGMRYFFQDPNPRASSEPVALGIPLQD